MNAVSPSIDQVLLNSISLKYHPTLMTAGGDLAVEAATSAEAKGNYILVVEGGIPTGSSGKYCSVWDEGGTPVTMASAVSRLAAHAQAVVAVGTCAAYGGIPSNFCGSAVKGVGSFLGQSVVNVPGCPPHPDWMIGTLAAALSGSLPALDANGRPRTYYTSEVIHERCPRRETEEASDFGQQGRCLEELGCKGPRSHADCDTRKWNNAQNWCIGANGLCIGCTEPSFPSFPFHGGEDGESDDDVGDDAVSGAATCVPASDATTPGDLTYHIYIPSVLNDAS
jgi:hydrogenase small subunit